MRLRCLTLRGLLLCVLLGKVPADHAANDSVVSRVMSGYSAHRCTLQATCSVRLSERCQRNEACRQYESSGFHLACSVLHIFTVNAFDVVECNIQAIKIEPAHARLTFAPA